ncbi:MAG: N-acetyltransferase [Tissierellia bacterium]|nr:N-acetyltransferase [Tissierellia bacterium]
MEILKGENCFYIGDTNSPLAMITYSVDEEKKLHIVDILIRPTLQGQGIGADLVKHVINFGLENEYTLDPECIYVKEYVEEVVED